MATLPTPAALYEKSMADIRGYGSATRDDLQQMYREEVGKGMQSLASSGLIGTSVAPSMRMGFLRQYHQSLNSLSQQIMQANMQANSTFGLGGIQAEQNAQNAANQLELGRGNLAVNRQHADLARQQLDLQRQQQAYSQNFEQAQWNQNLVNQRASFVPYENTMAGWNDKFNNVAAMSKAQFNYGW